MTDHNNNNGIMDSYSIEKKLNEKKAELKTLQQKFELNNKKIKLLRKENQQMKSMIQRNSQSDTTLLLQSKDLSDANSKLQSTIEQLELKLSEPAQAPIPEFVTIGDITVTEEVREVDLASKQLSDQQFSELAPFSKIETLMLDSNLLTNISVELICDRMKNIKKLLLNSNNFTSDSLSKIGQLTQLKSIQLNNNNLGDECLTYIINLAPSLTQLSVSKNKITDKGAQSLPKLSLLSYLDITNNLLTDEGAKQITGLKNITHLYIGWNKLTGLSVRWIIKDLQKLEALDVRLNSVSQQDKEKLRLNKPENLQMFC